MKKMVTLMLEEEVIARLNAEAAAAGMSREKLLRRKVEGNEPDRKIAEIHAVICGGNPRADLPMPEEAVAAVTGLVNVGLPKADAEKRVRAALALTPYATADALIAQALRQGGAK